MSKFKASARNNPNSVNRVAAEAAYKIMFSEEIQRAKRERAEADARSNVEAEMKKKSKKTRKEREAKAKAED